MEEKYIITTSEFCTICRGDSCNSENNTLLTELIIHHLIPPSQKNLFLGKKRFSFCTSCTEILEELHQLDERLKFIQKNVQQKKTEIQMKILKSQNNLNEPFQKLSTQDFCPRVEMNKKNALNPNSSLLKTNQEIYKLSKLYNKRRLPISPEKDEIDLEVAELESNPSLNKMDILSNKNKRSRLALDAGEDVESDSNVQKSPKPLHRNSVYNDNKIQSELISIDSGQIFPFDEEETIVKFEPWHHNDDKEIEQIESSVKKAIPNGANEVISVEKEPISNLEYPIVRWNKPPLSPNELTVLAIMISDSMLLYSSEIWEFIRSNFPYYRQKYNKNFWEDDVLPYLRNCPYITKQEQNGYIAYGLRQRFCTYEYCNHLLNKLSSNNLCSYMACPGIERIPTFRKLLQRTIVNHSNVTDYSDVYDGHNSDYPETTTNNISSVAQMQNSIVENVIPHQHPSHSENNKTVSNESKRCQIKAMKEAADVNSTMEKSQLLCKSDNDDKIQSELISIEYGQILHFNGGETIVKLEPWYEEHHKLEITNYDDKVVQIDTVSSADRSIIVPNGVNENINVEEPFLNQGGEIVQWTKPPLCYLELGILAITTSANMLVQVQEMYDFICSNFPYYAKCSTRWKSCLRHSIAHCSYITKYKTPKYQHRHQRYGLVSTFNCYNAYRNKLFDKLRQDNLSICMAYPERISDFRNSLKREIVDHYSCS